jgi:hypothetical protein
MHTMIRNELAVIDRSDKAHSTRAADLVKRPGR